MRVSRYDILDTPSGEVAFDRKRGEAALEESEARFRNMADHAPVIVWVTNAGGDCIYLNRRWHELTGQTPAGGEGYGWLDCLHPDDRAAKRQAFVAANAERRPFRIEYRLLRPDGQGWRWMISAAAPRYGDDGAFLGYVGSIIDIDERRRAEDALRKSEARLRRAQEAGGIGEWELDLDTGEVVWSERLYRLFDQEPGRFRPSRASALNLVHPEDRERVAAEVERTIAGYGALDTEFRVVLPDGAVRWLVSRGELVRDEGRPSRLAGVNFDVTERKAAEERIRELALQDPLTGLPNRRMLQMLLAHEVARAGRQGHALNLLLLDLDEFKRVNDTLGHSAGDVLLVEAARRLQACIRESDHVARLGGDEFAVLAATERGPGGPAALAVRLLAALGEPAELHGVEVRPGASVGVAVWPDDAANAEALLARADLALYAAKEAGRSTWRFFRPEMQEQARKASELDRDLRRALERGEFVLHYQPIVELGSLRLRGLEALLRWRHPDRGLVPPGEFLLAAERSRLIVPLTFWGLAEALRRAAAWRAEAEGLGEVYVAVNVAVSALETDGLVGHVAERLRAEGLPASSLLAEVTEGAMAAEDGGTMTALAGLRGLGVQVAIDDFGAGYSSLSRLRDLPLDLLKIDRTFLVPSGGRGEAILRVVVELARSLGLPTIAEGVETADQLALLSSIGLDCAQGFLLARPMPEEDIAPWVRAWSDAHSSTFRKMRAARAGSNE